MAAKYLDSEDVKKQELSDITTCCICTEVYTDPKALPCIHTFCLKCIQATGVKTNKGAGDEMPCPICRQMFKIPPKGFYGLPKNVFIERLLQVANASDSSTASKVVGLCDACQEDENEGTGKEISSAAKYCVDCKRKLCAECCNEHRDFKLTKKHKLIPMTEYESGEKVKSNLAPRLSVCELHEQKIVDVYCADCKTVVCSICFTADHKNHNGSHVKKFVDGFRKQIEGNHQVINECISQAEIRKAELLKTKEVIQGRVTALECDIENRKEEVKQLAEKHATSLLQDLCSIRQSKMKEIQMETDDIDAYLSSLDTYNSYCQNVMIKGSDSDICRSFADLSFRALELKEQCQPMIEREIQSFTFFFGKSELEQYLAESYDNLIGENQEEGESKRKQTDKQIVSAEPSNGSELLSLRSANEQLKIEINNEVEANKTHKMTIKKLKDNVEKLEHEISRMKQGQLQYISDPVLIHTIRRHAAEEEQDAIWCLTLLDKELFVVSWESSDVEVYDAITFRFSRRWDFKELVASADLRSCDRNKCLYFMDYKKYDKSKEILRVDAKGKLIKKWSTGDSWGILSVTNESNVILSDYKTSKLYEYSPEGQLIHEINLSSVAGIRYLKHAIKLTNDLCVVSHGYYDAIGGGGGGDDCQRVCIVDADGELKKSFGGERGSTIGQLNNTSYLYIDRNGFVMVADGLNSRVLLLDSNVEFKKEILSKEKYGLRHPSRILMDESSGRLFLADNRWYPEDITFTDGQILIFDF